MKNGDKKLIGSIKKFVENIFSRKQQEQKSREKALRGVSYQIVQSENKLFKINKNHSGLIFNF